MSSELPDTHREVRDLLPELALGSISNSQQRSLEAHLDQCDACAAEMVELNELHRLMAADPPAPPAGLRADVLASILDARPSRTPDPHPVVAAWEAETRRFVELLHSPPLRSGAETPNDSAWSNLCIPEFGLTVRDVACHLIAVESLWASALHAASVLIPENDVDIEERTRSVIARHRTLTVHETIAEFEEVIDAVRGALSALSEPDFAMESGMIPGFSLETYATYRSLETWVHNDDIRAALDMADQAPADSHVETMTRILPQWIATCIAQAAPDAPPATYRLELTGSGAATYEIHAGRPASGVADRRTEPDVTITCEAVGFCKLGAARRDPAAFRYEATGDVDLAAELIDLLPQFAVI